MTPASFPTRPQDAQGLYLALVWPAAKGRDADLTALFGPQAGLGSVTLTYRGAHNLLVQCYRNEVWLGPAEQEHPGVAKKLRSCFTGSGSLRLFALHAQDLEAVRDLKDRVRDLFGIDKASVHITDTPEETVLLAGLLLNPNGRHFLDHARPFRYPGLVERLARFRDALSERGLDPADYALDTGMVMAAYGLRPAEDVDYVTAGARFRAADIGPHDDALRHHGIAPELLVRDPAYHFWFDGVKFLSLAQVCAMKRNRGEAKDAYDLLLARRLEGGAGLFSADHRKLLALRLRRGLVRALERTGTKALARRLLRRGGRN